MHLKIPKCIENKLAKQNMKTKIKSQKEQVKVGTLVSKIDLHDLKLLADISRNILGENRADVTRTSKDIKVIKVRQITKLPK